MAELSSADRLRIWRGLMRYWSRLRALLNLDKSDLQAAVIATDSWIDDNAASFNAALPTAAQSGLTGVQKTLLFCAVALMRAGGADLLRRILGEVD